MDMRTGILKWANIVAFAITIVVNSLAGVGLINGISTAAVSDIYFTLITPAGYVFSIWGLIYILLGIFVVFQALPGQNARAFHKEISYLFVLSSVWNIVWIFLWQFKFITLSVIAIFALLITLIAIYLHLGIGKSSVSLRERLAVHVPFSTYLGWITIATIADVAAALVSAKWDGLGLGAANWAILVIVVALAIISLVIVTRRDIAYSFVAIWALIGIAVNQSGYPNVVAAAEISAIMVAVVLAGRVLVFRLRHQK
jgi:hypothetical protein